MECDTEQLKDYGRAAMEFNCMGFKPDSNFTSCVALGHLLVPYTPPVE